MKKSTLIPKTEDRNSWINSSSLSSLNHSDLEINIILFIIYVNYSFIHVIYSFIYYTHEKSRYNEKTFHLKHHM